MKNLKIKEACLVKGEHQAVGSILKEVDNGLAAELIHSGRAIEIKAETKAIVVENRDPVVENRDPKPAAKKAAEKEAKKAAPAAEPEPSPAPEKES